MLKRLAIRAHNIRVGRMVITHILNLIYTWRLSMKIIRRWGRAHKRLTSILVMHWYEGNDSKKLHMSSTFKEHKPL